VAVPKTKVRGYKKPACWLFLSLLLGCDSATPPQPGQLSYEQATRAQALQLNEQAFVLYQRSAELGFDAAIEKTLLLQQQLQRPSTTLATWWQALPASSQKQRAAQQLGYWDDIELSQQQVLLKSLQVQVNPTCALTVQPVLSDQRSVDRWLQLHASWPQQSLASLPICFASPLLVDSRRLACSQTGRLQCELTELENQVAQSPHPLWLLLGGRGNANYNNGFLLAPYSADWPLLSHELSHAFGFIDEYPLQAAVAADECLQGRITPNLLFSMHDLQNWRDYWQIKQPVELTPVDSCAAVGLPAWRPVATVTSLQHFEYPLPPLYLELIGKALQRKAEILPAQYLLAVQAKRRGELQTYQMLLKKAAQMGYPAAKQALAESQVPTQSARSVVR
jgi:hypothetical protein